MQENIEEKVAQKSSRLSSLSKNATKLLT